MSWQVLVDPWRDDRNLIGFLSGLVLAVADEVEQLTGPAQTNTLSGPAGIISRFNVIAWVLARAAIVRDKKTTKKDIDIAHHEAVSLSDFAGGVHNDGSELMTAAGRCAHALMFLIEDVPSSGRSSSRGRGVELYFPEDAGIPSPLFEPIERPWRHRDAHPSDELTLAFEAAINARELAFAYSLFEDRP